MKTGKMIYLPRGEMLVVDDNEVLLLFGDLLG